MFVLEVEVEPDANLGACVVSLRHAFLQGNRGT